MRLESPCVSIQPWWVSLLKISKSTHVCAITPAHHQRCISVYSFVDVYRAGGYVRGSLGVVRVGDGDDWTIITDILVYDAVRYLQTGRPLSFQQRR